MKLESFNTYCTLFIFIILLFCPFLGFQLLKARLPADDSENRILAEKPELSISKITEYPSKFDEYWNDHLPFRALIQTTYANLNYSLFNLSTTDRVIIGKKEDNDKIWLFYSDKTRGDPLGDVTGRKTFKEDEMEKAKNTIKRNEEKLKAKGIKYYVAIAPNKSTIKQHFLPSNIKILGDTRTNKLYKYLKENEINNFIYLKDGLLEADKIRNTYFRLDTHWNKYGGFIGTIEICKMMEPDILYLFNNVDFEETCRDNEGDLKKFTSISINMKDENYEAKSFLPNCKYTIDKKGEEVIYNCNDAPIKKSLLIVGDSYTDGVIKYLCKIYKRVVYIHSDQYYSDLIDKYNINNVLCLRVERYAYECVNLEL